MEVTQDHHVDCVDPNPAMSGQTALLKAEYTTQ
jgi:hypothetical protein